MIHYETFPLWEGDPPEALPDTSGQPLDTPQVTVHRPAKGHGGAVIVAPGGGYRILASDHEGLQVARFLNRIGFVALVLRYRVGERYHSSVSKLDGLRAVRFARAHADRFGIDPARVGFLGFSAGGHLTTTVGTHWDRGTADAADPIERESSRPDFLVPIYAVTNGLARGRKADEYTPTDVLVRDDTPPAFIVHTHEDAIVPAHQSTLFYDALLRAGVASELHVFGFGEHGGGLGAGDPDYARWTTLFEHWARRMGLLTPKPRIAISGTVRLGDAPLGMGWVTFTPTDASAPLARARFNRADDGAFSIDQAHGPTAGEHRVVVFHISDIYPHVATGDYSLDDARRYTVGVLDIDESPITIDL